MAAYQEHLDDIESNGVRFLALSVDKPEYSESLKAELGLTFTHLCDVDKQVVQSWDRFNKFEMGGIAKPALFIIDSERRVRFRSDGEMRSRYGVEDLLQFLRSGATISNLEIPVRRPVIPRLSQTLGTVKKYIVRHITG